MSTERHATINEQVADLKARLQGLGIFQDVLVCKSTSLQRLLDIIQTLALLPAAILVIGPAEYPDADPDAPPQRDRVIEPGIVVVGEYSADTDAGDADVWDLVDAVDRSFTPPAAAPNTLVSINDVEYTPLSMVPLNAGEDRSAYMLTLRAIDCVISRSDV